MAHAFTKLFLEPKNMAPIRRDLEQRRARTVCDRSTLFDCLVRADDFGDLKRSSCCELQARDSQARRSPRHIVAGDDSV